MNRDNVLFVILGVLVGFIAGYLLHEVVAARQPQRLIHGGAAAMAPPVAPADAPDEVQARAHAQLEEMRSLETYLATTPNDVRAVLRLANLSFSVGAWNRCTEMYGRYLELADETPDALSDLGVCYRELGEQERALELFDRAQTLDPGHWQSRFNEVVVLAFDLRDFARAERVLDELRGLQPGNRDVEALAAEVARRRDAAT